MSVVDELVETAVAEVLDEIPAAVVRPVVKLAIGIVRVVLAGPDVQKREAALMKTAEDLKAELDAAKFGGG